jgi:hypothetical protein
MSIRAILKIEKLQKDLKEKYTINQSEMEKIAEDMANKIKVRTRLGYDVDRSKLPPIKSEKYKKKRANYKKKGKLSDQTTPGRSNLTFTGQLLDSLYGKSYANNTFTIELKEKRDNESVTNSEVTIYQELQNRIYFGFSDAEKKYLLRKIIDIFLRKG